MVSTFPHTCVRILRNQAAIEGLNQLFDMTPTIRGGCCDGGPATWAWNIKRYSPRLLANAISNLENELIDRMSAGRQRRTPMSLARAVAWFMTEYQRLTAGANARTGDLIGETSRCCRQLPANRPSYRRRFRHVLVPGHQYVLVRELESAGSNDGIHPRRCASSGLPISRLCVRSATIRNIEDFRT